MTNLLGQIQKKVLYIRKALYPDYELLFIFDSATSYAVYAKDVLEIENINKNCSGQKLFLCLGWYIGVDREMITPQIYYLHFNF